MLNQPRIEDSRRNESTTANPAALGLFGLAVVTLVASSHKLGITSGTLYLIPWAIFLGATAQLIAGFLDFKLKNTFGATAFCGYGLFWLAIGMTWMLNNGVLVSQASAVADPAQLGIAFLGYLIFTAYMTLGAAGTNKVLFIIFVLIDMLFLGLFFSTFGWAVAFWTWFAGLSEMGIAVFSFYASASNVLNSHYGRIVLPLGSPFGPWISRPEARRTEEDFEIRKAS